MEPDGTFHQYQTFIRTSLRDSGEQRRLIPSNSAITLTADSFVFRSYCTHKPHFPNLHVFCNSQSYCILPSIHKRNIVGHHTEDSTVMASHRPTQLTNDGEGLVACQQSVSGSEWTSLTAS